MANVGHGWVHPRDDGVRARCGGPTMCPVCQRELAESEAMRHVMNGLLKMLDGSHSCKWPPRAGDSIVIDTSQF